jgi:hypothetical protein
MLTQEENPGVEFEYSLPSGAVKETPSGGEGYAWTTGSWSGCDAQCGGGSQTRTVICANTASKEVVANNLCDEAQRPQTSEPCNEDPCEVQT